jgi:hypothetical protein
MLQLIIPLDVLVLVPVRRRQRSGMKILLVLGLCRVIGYLFDALSLVIGGVSQTAEEPGCGENATWRECSSVE